MLTALVPTPTEERIEVDYKAEHEKLESLLEDTFKDVKLLQDENYELKQELDALRMKHKELDEEHWNLLGREAGLENKLAKLTAKYMSAKYALEAAERCIINMALKLHGGDDDA